MGLDSVELLMEFEKFFAIDIPDRTAEKLYTVQDVVDCVCGLVIFTGHGGDIKKDIFKELEYAFIELGIVQKIKPDEKIFDLISFADLEAWKKVSDKIKYELPSPYLKGFIGKLLNKIFSPKQGFENTSVDRFVDLTAALNYEAVLDKSRIKNEYEVLIGVMGMTIKNLGINPFEVFPDKSFVKDFGIS